MDINKSWVSHVNNFIILFMFFGKDCEVDFDMVLKVFISSRTFIIENCFLPVLVIGSWVRDISEWITRILCCDLFCARCVALKLFCHERINWLYEHMKKFMKTSFYIAFLSKSFYKETLEENILLQKQEKMCEHFLYA